MTRSDSNQRGADDRDAPSRDPHLNSVRLRRLAKQPIDLNTAKRAARTADLPRVVYCATETETNFGVDAEYDLLVLACNELADFISEVERRADAILARYGLTDHGFTSALVTHYYPKLDKHASDDTPT